MYQRQLTFSEAVNRALKVNYCNFSGRASLSEYWWFCLFSVIVGAVLKVITLFSGSVGDILSYVIGVLLFLPSLGLSVRRLHDIGKSGWWVLISLIPIVGFIVLIVFFVKPSQPSENEYGPVPNLTV